jgi:endonuclease-8
MPEVLPVLGHGGRYSRNPVCSMSVVGAKLSPVPEGDTIHRTAGRLKPVLEGKTVRSFDAARLVESGPEVGTTIESVEAVGKYLLVRFGDGTTLETHMKMSGSWHIYQIGERWRRSARSAMATIETEDGWVAVCFSAPHVKLIRTDRRPTSSVMGPRVGGAATDHLGPDLCLPSPDIEEAVRRFAVRTADTPAAVALLDQRICCGVGNVYKSEVLFACGIHPATPVGQLGIDIRRTLVETAATMLQQNLGSGPRVTVVVNGRPGLAVYGRVGLPCIRCGGPVSSGTHGIHARSTYWCPSCQPMVSNGAESPDVGVGG